MRNAGLSEACCQNEVSESKAPAASNMTSKVRRSRRVTDSLQADGVPFGGCKIDNRAGKSLSRPDAQVFQSRCWRLSVASDGVRLFDNGNVFGVRWEAQRHTAFLCSASRLRGRSLKHADNFEVSPDWCSANAKVASKAASRCACHRSPKKCAKRCPKCLRSFVVLIKNELNNGREKYEDTDNGENRPAL